MTELAVLVPVLNRPGNVKSLVESFEANCPDDAELVFIVNSDDHAEIEALNQPGSRFLYTVVDDPIRSWPTKINRGVDLMDRFGGPAWLLCAADDITFTPGWWEATAELRAVPYIGVIGTNDSATGQGNPRVAAGEHTCHPLIRASYIHKFGTIDQRGYAVHEGYQHSFVDDELVLTAKGRGAWAFCKEAVVAHEHPWWTSMEKWDATYDKGQESFEQDKAVFAERIKLLGYELA